MVKMLMTCIGVINNVYQTYFALSYYVIDWFTLTQIPAMVLATFIFSALSFNSITNSRKLFIFTSFSAVLSSTCSLVSFALNNLFAFIFLGQFLIGFGSLGSEAIVSSIAINWFPENQIGLALSFKAMGAAIGSLLGFLVPSQIFSIAIPTENGSSYSHGCQNVSNDLLFRNWCTNVRIKFLILYGALLLICITIWILVVGLVIEKPLTPPSIAQALKPNQEQGNLHDLLKNRIQYIKKLKAVVSSRLVIQLASIAATINNCNDLQKLLMGEIFREKILSSSNPKAAESWAGYALVLFELGCLVGSFVSAKLIDKFKKHKITLCVMIALCTICVVGFALVVHYKNILLSYVLNWLFGVLIGSSSVPIFDMLLQHTYPSNPAFVMLIFVGMYKFASVIFGEICRVLLNYFNVVAVFIFIIILLLITLAVSTFLQPNYERNMASNVESSLDENLLLLGNNEQQ